MWTYRRNVDRRALGAVVLLMTAFLAVVITRSMGERIQGVAATVPVQQPPIVGQCILDDPTSSAEELGRLAALRYGSCSGPHYGEIVQVFDDSAKVARIDADADGPPDPSICTAAATSYLSADQVQPRFDRGDFRSVSFGAWQPISVGLVGVTGPSVIQRSVGQQWLACMTEGNTNSPFLGTVRGAFVGGTVPNSYALCTDQLRGGDPVDCARPHTTELFANTGIVDNLPTDADLTATCTDFVRYLTGRSDLLVGGRLQVEVTTAYYGETGHPIAGQPSSVQTLLAQAFCGVAAVGGSQLTATLFGIRNRPLPLS